MTDTADTIKLRGISYTVDDCITCGVPYAVPKNVYEQHRTNGGFHCCPNGHQQGWSINSSEIGLVRRERDRLKQEQARLMDEAAELRRQKENAEKRAADAIRAKQRLRTRVQNGVCPDCNRSFTNLRQHMATKHKPTCDVIRLAAVS